MKIPDIEKQSPQTLAEYQNRELASAIRYAAARSPFYQKHFMTHGIDPQRVNNLNDLRTIPPTTKDDLQNYNWDFLCVPRSAIVEYTSTSGTLGKPVTVALTAGDLQRLAYNESASFVCAGLQQTDVVQLMLTLDKQFMAGLAYHEGVRKLGAAAVRIGPGLPALQWQTIFNLKSTVLIGVASFVVKLLEYAKQNQIDYKNSSVRTVICIGENIRTENLELNVLGKRIKDMWDVNLISTYASTEMQTAFTECEHGRGGHHRPELVIVELLNEANESVAPSEAGEVTVTTLGVEGMPLIRYKTGDMARLFTEPCTCGRTTMRISPLIGRKQQMIKLKGTTLYPQALFEVLQHTPGVLEYVVETFTNETGVDEVRVLVASTDWETTRTLLAGNFKAALRVLPEMVLSSAEELEKLQFTGGSRKIRRFIDNRL